MRHQTPSLQQIGLKINDVEVQAGELARSAGAPTVAVQRGAPRKKIAILRDQIVEDHKVEVPEEKIPATDSVVSSSGEGYLLAQADTGVSTDASVGAETTLTSKESVFGALDSGFSSTTMAFVAAGVAGAAGIFAVAGGSRSNGGDSSAVPHSPSVVDNAAPLFSSSSRAVVAENASSRTVIYRAQATDNVGVTGYALAGGADDDKFTLDANTGELKFKVSPDFENPGSVAGNNAYTVKIKAVDEAGNATVQAVTVNVTDVDDISPVFTSGTSISVMENTPAGSAVYHANATDNVGVSAYAFAGGADDGKFNIDAVTGAISFKAAPDYEAPGSAAGGNAYALKIEARDAAGNSAIHNLTVNVADVVGTEVSGSITAGPVVAAGLQVQVQTYGVNGWAISGAPVEVDASGNYRLHLTDGYVGAFRLSVLDGNGSQQPDYRDEASGLLKNIGELNLVAYADGSKATPIVANITPLTTLAGSLAADSLAGTNDTVLQKSVIDNSGLAVAKMFGLSMDVALNAQSPQVVISPTGEALHGNAYGAALAVVSGIEQAQGKSTLDVVTAIKAGVSTDLYYAGMADLQIGLDPGVQVMLQQGQSASQTLLAAGGNQALGEQVVQSCTNLTLDSANLIFANMGQHRVGDSSGQIGVYGDKLGETGGYYRTMFELAAASYVHPDSLGRYPGMAAMDQSDTAAYNLKVNSLQDLKNQGVSFSISAADLNLLAPPADQAQISTTGTYYANGYYVSYDTDGVDRSSVALLGRSKDALLLSFRGTDSAGDGWDDLLNMSGHYLRYEPLINGINTYLENHPEITKVYVGGHSLGGEMAALFMGNHPQGWCLSDGREISVESVVFEPANKINEYGYPILGSAVLSDSRIVSFETRGDPVPDLSLNDQDALDNKSQDAGRNVYIEPEVVGIGTYGLEPHFMASMDAYVDTVFSRIPGYEDLRPAARYYLDQNHDGVIETYARSGLDLRSMELASDIANSKISTLLKAAGLETYVNAAGLIAAGGLDALENRLNTEDDAEYKATAYTINTLFDALGGVLVINAVDGLSGGEYKLTEANVQTVILNNDTKNFNLDARLADHYVNLVGNNADNTLRASDVGGLLIGMGGTDQLLGGVGQDVLVSGERDDLIKTATGSHFGMLEGYLIHDNRSGYETYLRSGFGEDMVYCSDSKYDKVFCDIKLSDPHGYVDNVRYFSPEQGYGSDYLIFSLSQLGINYTTADQIGKKNFGKILGADVWTLNQNNFQLGTDYSNLNQDTFYIKDDYLYFDPSGKDGATPYVLVKLQDVDGGIQSFDASNILLVKNFDELDFDSVPIPNHVPTGTVSFTGNLVVGETLTATNTLQDADGLGAVSYAWQSSLNGSTDWGTVSNGSSFTLNASLQNKYIRAVAQYTDGHGTSEAVASATSSTAVSSGATYTPGQAVIDLGEYGKLINPVFVDQKWYYAWDLNGDGAQNGTKDATGKFNYDGSMSNSGGAGYQYDYMTHDVLDGIFKYASNFNTQNPGPDTDNTYRFAQIDAVKLVLPTIGEEPLNYDSRPGTAIDNSPVGETNPTYDDLLAIGDAIGEPAGWWANVYWSATPSAHGHASLNFGSGYGCYVWDNQDRSSLYAAVQVLTSSPDIRSPVFTNLVTDVHPIAENTAAGTVVYDANATDEGQAVDIGITYSLLGADQSWFSIDASTGAMRFKTSPDYEHPVDSGHNNVYDFTVRATDAANNHADQAISLSVTNFQESSTYTPGQSVIDLGEYGQLIDPVFVDQKWYYAWDMNRDGAQNWQANSGGRLSFDGTVVNPAGTGFKFDFVYHNVLDNLFKYAADFQTLNPGADTSDIYRFAELGGVKLALPTLGESQLSLGPHPGTDVDNQPAGENNPTYDDLLAIWDGFNGAGDIGSAPTGWSQTSAFWSATGYISGHAGVGMSNGYVNDYYDNINTYVALEVMPVL